MTCALCRQPLPTAAPAPAADARAEAVAELLARGPTTARQAAVWLWGAVRPAAADVERARRMLERAVAGGRAVRTVGADGLTDRPLVTYHPAPSTG